MSRSSSLGFSSFPGPTDGYLFYGMKTRGMHALFPAVGEQLCSMLAVSMDDRIKVSLQLDHNYIKDPTLFADLLRIRMNRFIEYSSIKSHLIQHQQEEATEIISSKQVAKM